MPSLSEASRKQAPQLRCQRPDSWLATAKQHGAASFKRSRAAECQCRMSLSEASRKQALEPRFASKQPARDSKTPWSCQFQRASACRMPSQCPTSFSEPCRKEALEPRRQGPNRRLATAKQHGAASFKGCRPAGCQCRTSLSEASRKEALEPRRQRPNSGLPTARPRRCLPMPGLATLPQHPGAAFTLSCHGQASVASWNPSKNIRLPPDARNDTFSLTQSPCSSLGSADEI